MLLLFFADFNRSKVTTPFRYTLGTPRNTYQYGLRNKDPVVRPIRPSCEAWGDALQASEQKSDIGLPLRNEMYPIERLMRGPQKGWGRFKADRYP